MVPSIKLDAEHAQLPSEIVGKTGHVVLVDHASGMGRATIGALVWASGNLRKDYFSY